MALVSNIFLLFILIIFILFATLYVADYLCFERYNQSPLNLKTIDGTDQPYHPSVLYFPDGWNGYKYWMVETPYPINVKPYKDRWECPSIHASNDGYDWIIPQGLTNPIDGLSEEQIKEKDFFSDPHLVYRNGVLECFYRFSERLPDGSFHNWMLRKSSRDGLHWSARDILLDFNDDAVLASVGGMVRSHAILYRAQKYEMWYVDCVNPRDEKHVCYATSDDAKSWTKNQICTLNGYSVNPWHLDVNVINGEYILTIYDFNDITLWRGSDPLTFNYVKTLLKPSGVFGCFYSDGLYRTSIIKDDQNIKLYFSAFSERKTSIGLMEGSNVSSLRIKSINGRYVSFSHFFTPFYENWIRRLWRIKQKVQL